MKVRVVPEVKVSWDGFNPRKGNRHLCLRTANSMDTLIGLLSSGNQEGSLHVAVIGLFCSPLLEGHRAQMWDS